MLLGVYKVIINGFPDKHPPEAIHAKSARVRKDHAGSRQSSGCCGLFLANSALALYSGNGITNPLSACPFGEQV
jgi:hypothetical protein